MKKIFYRVEKEDSILSVAKKLNVPAEMIIRQNNLNCEIAEGDLLVITPPKKVYKVQLGDTIFSVAESLGISVETIKERNQIDYIYYGQIIIVE